MMWSGCGYWMWIMKMWIVHIHENWFNDGEDMCDSEAEPGG